MPNNPQNKQTPLKSLKGVGPKAVERLNRLGIASVEDILFHLPLRYEDRSRVVAMGSLRFGDHAVIEGEVEYAQVKFGKRRSLMVRVADGTGFMMLRFFYFSAAQQQGLAKGQRIRCYGEVRQGPGSLEMIHPEYRQMNEDSEMIMEESLTPVYPTTEGMHQMTWRDLTSQALLKLEAEQLALHDLMPEEILQQQDLPDLKSALQFIHRPPVDVSITSLEQGDYPARHRLVFEELLAQQLSLRLLRQHLKQQQSVSIKSSGKLRQRLLEQLPFSLTNAQNHVIAEIDHDLQSGQAMLRLVQGDVGSGKTLVAAMVAIEIVESGYQVALMAPTELLAEQHFRNLSQWLLALGIEPGYLSGKSKGKARKQQLERLESGETQVIIGTHALFQDDVSYNRLALVIVDEQHRFGVDQRRSMQQKGTNEEWVAHQLVMTATPIPRTLAMTAYADLDLSIIDELPPGRTPVTTVALPDSRRDAVIQRVEKACLSGRQAYWVCTLIEESEALQCQAAEDTHAGLVLAMPGLKIGLVHGRMKAAEKQAVMDSFKSGELHVLVATTVIEVGVDVPNASLMIIENPERLGLSQLHQLRGRVGRGSVESHCLLLYKAPLSENARSRLDIMRETNDGFEVARKDLQLRGPGEVLGTRQTGVLKLRIADLMLDQSMIPAAQQAADQLLSKNSELVKPLMDRWVGQRMDYGKV